MLLNVKSVAGDGVDSALNWLVLGIIRDGFGFGMKFHYVCHARFTTFA